VRAFGYQRADTAREAVAALTERPEGAYLGGGTNLVDLMRLGVMRPSDLVDVTTAVPRTVEPADDGGLVIGAGVRNSELAADPRVRRDYPVLSHALLAGASGQLRNMATVGGNLLQRTRCLYFQDVTKPCNKRDPGSGCPARTGLHRDLGVLGVSDSCIATHPSDMAVALAALDAVVRVESADGARELAVADFYRLPGDDPARDTTLRHGDLVTAVRLPPATPLSGRSAYRKVRDRASYAFAVASVAAALSLEDGIVSDVRIAFGAVAPMPWRAMIAEDALRGSNLSSDAVLAAVAQEMRAARPLPDNLFKVELTGRITAELLLRLAGHSAEDAR
jgi:xanthine dehydrogenase YagS FAD-binding subunit